MVSRLESAKVEPQPAASAFGLEASSPAVDQLKGLLKVQKPGMAVRVFVQMGGGGGGCCGGGSGPAFGMAFDKPKNGDEVVKVDGVNFIVDPYSVEFLNGAHVDFVQENGESGFKISNPTLPMSEGGSGGGCGSCGASADNGGGCGCGSGGGGCGCG